MKHYRRKTRKSLVRNPRFTVSESDILFGGALLLLTLVKSLAFNGVM